MNNTVMMVIMCTDDDDEWTEVSASQLQQQVDTPVGDTADTLPADTLPPYTQEVMTAAQHGRDAVTSSLDSHTPSLEMSSGPAAVTSISSSSSACIDAHDSQHVTPAAVPAPAEVCSDVTEAPADSMVNPAASTDHDSVGSSLSSDNTKSDSLVVVAVTPERTSPSEESSNAKGLLLSFLALLYTCVCHRLRLAGHHSLETDLYNSSALYIFECFSRN